MEKIVIVSREPGNHAHMIALIEAVFPECTVEIIRKAGDRPEPLRSAMENHLAVSGKRAFPPVR